MSGVKQSEDEINKLIKKRVNNQTEMNQRLLDGNREDGINQRGKKFKIN